MSENAQAVAKDVMEAVRKGLKVDKGDIIRNHGYSDSVSKKPKKVTETLSYKKTMKPFLQQLEDEIAKIQLELSGRNLGEEKYKDLVDALDKLNKQVILATGGETERVGITIQLSEAIAKKNDINPSPESNSSGPT